MKKQGINNYRIGLCFLFVLYAFLPNSVYAQWGFTTTFSYVGECYGIDYSWPSLSFPISGIPTKAECESLRNSFLNIQVGGNGCRVSYRCTPCTGSDIATSQQMTVGSISIVGTGTGKAFFSPSQARTAQDWINSVQQQWQIFGDNTNVSNNSFTLPTTGDNSFDKTYQDGVVAYIEKSGLPIISAGATVKRNEAPSLPEVDMDKSRKIAEVERQMISSLEELNKIERLKVYFCKISSSDCEYYQEKWNKVNNTLRETENELKDLKKNEYQIEYDQYKQEREKYEQQKPENKFMEYQAQQVKTNLDELIKNSEESINGIDTEIDEKRRYIDERDSQMSWADKTDEIADERLKRIGEQRAELYEKLKSNDISLIMYQTMNEDLSLQEKDAMSAKLAAKTARTATNAYEYVKENKDKVIDGVEFIAHTGVNIATLGAAPETAGTSLVLGTIAHVEISTLANIARGQNPGSAVRGAVRNELKSAAINKFVPINLKGMSSSEILGTAITGWKLAQ